MSPQIRIGKIVDYFLRKLLSQIKIMVLNTEFVRNFSCIGD